MQSVDKQQPIQLNDTAYALRLSPSTVSRAISGSGRASASTRTRVLEYIKQHDYHPNSIARSLAKSRTFNIGVALPSESFSSEIPFSQAALMGVAQTALGHDYDVIVLSSSDQDLSSLKRLIINRKVNGIVLTRSVSNDPSLAYLQSNGIPFVLIGTTDDASVAQVDADNAACRELTVRMLSRGVKRPGLICGSSAYTVNQSRRSGFAAGARDAGIRAGDCITVSDVSEKSAIYSAVDRLIASGADCIFCGDDYICSRVLSHIAKPGQPGRSVVRIASFFLQRAA